MSSDFVVTTAHYDQLFSGVLKVVVARKRAMVHDVSREPTYERIEQIATLLISMAVGLMVLRDVAGDIQLNWRRLKRGDVAKKKSSRQGSTNGAIVV